MKHKIRIIHLNFHPDEEGPFPSYFNGNLLSCSYNPDFEWLIFTNRLNIPPLPSNVKVVKLSLGGFSDLIEEKLNIKPNLKVSHRNKLWTRTAARKRSYVKTCEYRHAFGVIFEDYLTGYDFWVIVILMLSMET